MEEKGGAKTNKMEKSQSVYTISGDSLNTASTLKLTEYEMTSKNKSIIADSEKVYNPFDHRDMTNSTSDIGALIHLIKSSLGSGILAMPGAFKHGGTVFGLVGTVLVGILSTHCVHLLVHCAQILCIRLKRPSLGFSETAESAFKTGPEWAKRSSRFAKIFVNTSLFATYYFGNTVYVVFIAESIQEVLREQLDWDIGIRLYILLVAVPLLPLAMIRHLKYIIPFSFTANIFIFFGLIMTLYFIMSDLSNIEPSDYFRPIQDLPLFFSTVLFAMEGIGTVLPIENSMKKPYHFLGCPGVLNTAMSLVVLLYASVGFFGYYKFGNNTLPSVTLNLGTSWLAETVKILVALSILLTYGLQFTVPTEILWKELSKRINENNHTLGYYTMRTVMILGTVLLAVIVPSLEPFIGLVGSICFSILGLLCPALIEAMTYYEEGYGPFRWRLIKDVIIASLSIVALVSGSYASILGIIDFYHKESS